MPGLAEIDVLVRTTRVDDNAKPSALVHVPRVLVLAVEGVYKRPGIEAFIHAV